MYNNFKNCNTYVRTLRGLRGVDMDSNISNHLLMGVWIIVKLKKTDKRKPVKRIVKFNIDKLKNENKTYKENIE